LNFKIFLSKVLNLIHNYTVFAVTNYFQSLNVWVVVPTHVKLYIESHSVKYIAFRNLQKNTLYNLYCFLLCEASRGDLLKMGRLVRRNSRIVD